MTETEYTIEGSGQVVKTVVLELYKDVTAGTQDATENWTPASGTFTIKNAQGEGAFDINCAIEVLFGGELVWITKGSSNMSAAKEFTGDGVKQVELVLNATDLPTGSVFLGGRVEIEQVT